jgi:hypothetical protein
MHKAIVAKDWATLKGLFHPDFERYAFGHFVRIEKFLLWFVSS